MYDLLLRNAWAVCPGYSGLLDVAVTGETIAAIGQPGQLAADARRVIAATGRYLLPGGVDPHIHISARGPGGIAASYTATTIAAAYGGTTTLINFADHQPGVPLAATVEHWREIGSQACAVDFGLHSMVGPMAWDELDGVEAVVRAGVPSFKAFMLDSKSRRGVDDGLLYALLLAARASGGLVGVHAESGPLNAYFTGKLAREDKADLRHFAEARPSLSEVEATHRAIFLARAAGAPLFVFHVSTAGAVAAIREAQRAGQPVYGETCPHYLFFTDEVYVDERDILFNRVPPMRPAADQAALWEGLADGTLAAISTDEVASSRADKLRVGRDVPVDQLPGGMSQVETRLVTIYSAAVASGRLSLERYVDLVSAGPARVFGLYPRKGAIVVGSDADLVLFDPAAEWTLTSEGLHSPADYTIYEGWKLRGRVAMTILRGKVIVEDNAYVGTVGDGAFVAREPMRLD
jgi:dihydropyrimidinase